MALGKRRESGYELRTPETGSALVFLFLFLFFIFHMRESMALKILEGDTFFLQGSTFIA